MLKKIDPDNNRRNLDIAIFEIRSIVESGSSPPFRQYPLPFDGCYYLLEFHQPVNIIMWIDIAMSDS